MSDVAVGVESGVRVEVIVRVRVIYTASGLESDPEESVPVSKLTFEEELFTCYPLIISRSHTPE